MLKVFFKGLYVLAIYAILYLPLVFTMIFSFNDSRYSVRWQGFTLRWYERLVQNSSLIDSAVNSLILAVTSATASTVIGMVVAITMYRYAFRGKEIVGASLYVIMMSPEIIMAISLVMLFIVIGIPLGYTTLLLSHTAFSFPFVAATVLARLSGFNNHILEAAQDLGASEMKTLRYIMIPMIFPALLAGWLMSFTLSLDDVIISFFVTGPSFEILPLKVYSMVKTGVKPDVNALCTILFSLTFIVVFTSYFLIGRKK